ncbi:hypothetical protein, partial [Pedobacter sp. L105]|uniref:hypothetical protein n=1 Tax=Pedobacter sp. L105 TaxID=1641871 RepID=UPI00131B03DC
MTYSIIKDAYNTAIWYGFAGSVPAFVFDHNIITSCYYVMVYPAENGQPHFTFRNSVITDNAHYLGNYPKAQDKFFPDTNRAIKEVNVKHSGKVRLTEVMDDGLTSNYLQPTAGSAGRNIGAGIYKNSRKQ